MRNGMAGRAVLAAAAAAALLAGGPAARGEDADSGSADPGVDPVEVLEIKAKIQELMKDAAAIVDGSTNPRARAIAQYLLETLQLLYDYAESLLEE